MSQSMVYAKERDTSYRQWQFKEAVELEHKKQELTEERRQLDAERRAFEREKQEFYLKKQVEENRLEQDKKLFDMKWKILEGELKKLAAEKEQVARQRDFYRYVNEYEYGSRFEAKNVIKGEMFFCGVDSEDTLKKRYKDLIKIYHPDNLDGDKDTIQEINSQYHKLCAVYK